MLRIRLLFVCVLLVGITTSTATAQGRLGRKTKPFRHPKIVRRAESYFSNPIRTQVTPVYPTLAVAAQVEGDAMVEVQVNKSGWVTSAQGISGHPLLQRAGRDAALKWRFEPVRCGPTPLKAVGRIRFRYMIDYRIDTLLVSLNSVGRIPPLCAGAGQPLER